MPNWFYCDHRAPAVLPKKVRDPEVIGFPIGLSGFILIILTVAAWIPAMDTYAWFQVSVTALLGVWVWYLAMCLKWIVKIPGNSAYEINRSLLEIQKVYRDRSDLREVLEPVLLAAYGFARTGQYAPVEKRLAAIQELSSASAVAATEDTSDLDALQMYLDVRKQMRKDGLL